MINVCLTPLMLGALHLALKDVHHDIKSQLDMSSIKVYEPSADVSLTERTADLIFRAFPIAVDHYGSSLAFYDAFRKLNYFITTYEFFRDNRIDYNYFLLSSEDILVLNSFKLFKGESGCIH